MIPQASIKKQIDELVKEIQTHDHAYYVLDKPLVADAVRDSLKGELENLEKQYPEFITADSPTQRIGGKALGKFAKYKHQHPKYSIDDVFSFEDVLEFDRRVKRFLALPANPRFGISNPAARLDGASSAILFPSDRDCLPK